MNTNTPAYARRKARLARARKRNRRMRQLAIGIYTMTIMLCTVLLSASAIHLAGYTIIPCEEFMKPAVARESNTPTIMTPTTIETVFPKVVPLAQFIELSDVQYAPPAETTSEVIEPEPAEVKEDEIEEVVITPPAAIIEETITDEVITTPTPPPVDVVEEETTDSTFTSYINPNARPSGVPEDKYFGWSEEDFIWLRRIIVGESQNCSREEQLETGSVVLNRLYNEKYFGYANTIEDVVLARGQYTCIHDGNAYKDPTDLNTEVTMELLKNGSVSPVNVIFQSLGAQGDGVYKYFPDTGTYICYKN